METGKLVSVINAAKRLRVTKMTIYRWARAKPPRINSKEHDGFLFIPEEEIDRVEKERNDETR
jgi:hypothetical protein